MEARYLMLLPLLYRSRSVQQSVKVWVNRPFYPTCARVLQEHVAESIKGMQIFESKIDDVKGLGLSTFFSMV